MTYANALFCYIKPLYFFLTENWLWIFLENRERILDDTFNVHIKNGIFVLIKK